MLGSALIAGCSLSQTSKIAMPQVSLCFCFHDKESLFGSHVLRSSSESKSNTSKKSKKSKK